MHAARAHNDREIVLRAPESRENPTRGPGRSGCVATVPTRVKGLFCVAWLWPGQAAGSVCFCVLVLVLAAFFLLLLFGRVLGLLFVYCCYCFSRPPLERRRAVRSQWPTSLRPLLGRGRSCCTTHLEISAGFTSVSPIIENQCSESSMSTRSYSSRLSPPHRPRACVMC